MEGYIGTKKKSSFVKEQKKQEGKGGTYIFLWRRKKTKTEKEENIWRRKIIFCRGEKNGEGKSISGRQTELRERARIFHSDLQ